jgi:BON domain
VHLSGPRPPDDGGDRDEMPELPAGAFEDILASDDFFTPDWAFVRLDDEHLATRTATALQEDPLVTGRRLEVLVQNGVVILLGELDSTEARAAARRRVWRVPGVRDLCNRIGISGTDDTSR